MKQYDEYVEYGNVTIYNDEYLKKEILNVSPDTNVFTYSVKFDKISGELRKFTDNIYLYFDYKLKHSENIIIIMPLDKINANILYVLLNSADNITIIVK